MNPYHKIKDFHGARKLGVGASDIPTLAGLNKRWGQTPLTLWREKKGLSDPFEGNERTYWGNELEVSVLKKFVSGRYGEDVAFDFQAAAIRGRSMGPFKVKTEAIHPERRYCLSHADLVVDLEGSVVIEKTCNNGAPTGVEYPAESYLVEAKTSGLYSAKRREGQIFEGYDPDDRSQFGIPDKVFMQVQWQLYTYGLTEAWVVVLIDTADYREYGPIVFDPRHVEKSLALAERFWKLVESNIEPTPITWGDVVSLYPDLSDKTAMVSGDEETKARAIIARGNDLKAKKKAIDDELDDIKSSLGLLAGDMVEEDGTIKPSMNRVLNDSSGNKLATFRDQTKDSLSLAEWLNSAEKKHKKFEAAKKKWNADKLTESEYLEICTDCMLSTDEMIAVEMEKELRKLGAYKTSEAYRIVSY